MKCNKCLTPIISGETKCRFCGTVVEDVIEIIEEQPEIIKEDDMMDQIIDIDQPKIKGPKIIEAKKEIDINDELEKTARLQKIDIEEFTGRIEAKEVEEIKERFKETKIKEEKKNEKPKKKDIKKEEINSKFMENSNLYIALGVLTILVVIFGVSTGYLFVNRNVFKKAQLEKISTTLKETFFDTYEISVPDNWLSKNEADKEIVVYFDDTYEWAASMEVIANVDFDKINDKKEEISSTFSKNRYIFTSDYTKTVNDKEFFLYKGKYDSYIVYLIINKIDDGKVLVTDLKFKGEVDKDVLDTLLNSISELKNNDLSKLYESNFEFTRNGEIIKENITQEGTLDR